MTHFCPWSNPIAASLQSLGHEVHVFDFSNNQRGGFLDIKNPQIASDYELYKKRISGVHLVHTLLNNRLKYVTTASKLRYIAKKINADIILTLYGGGFALMAYLSGIRPYAVYVVGSDVLFVRHITRVINRLVLTTASYVFSNGDYLALRACEQAPNARILPLLIGVNLSSLKMSDFTANPIQLICTRGFEPVYNNNAIIRAISIFPDDSPDFRMVFVSGGSKLKESIALADKVLSKRLREKIIFWGGVSYEKVLNGLSHSHIFISMSRSDGMSTSILEAMGSGLFPILSDIPQNRSLIQPEDPNGSLVPLDNDRALSFTIFNAIRNVNMCIQYASINRSLIAQKADANRNRKILAQHLEEIVKNNKKEQKNEA
jgi:glycosyltransferase involved in cell wall biosynthesis